MRTVSTRNHARNPREQATLNGDSTDPRTLWVRRHQGALWRWVRGLGAAHATAEDIVQDALMAAIAQADWADWTEDRSRRWLRVTSRNLWRRHLRSEARHNRRINYWAQSSAKEDEAVSHDYLDALRKCQDELGPRAIHALELRYGDNAGWDAIGRQLNLRTEGVKSLLQRIRTTLRACVERTLTSEPTKGSR